VHGVAALGFKLALGGKHLFGRTACLVLPRFDFGVKFVRLTSRGL